VVAFADSPRDRRHGSDAQSRRQRVDDRQHRLGEADRGHGVGAEPRHEEHVDDSEDRFEREFQDHRDGEEQDRAPDVAFGVFAMRAGQCLANRRPHTGSIVGYQCRDGGFRTHDSS
jgi:hypothetical protein